jgi:soluble lytic murein transglycosylase-like protein
MFSESRALRACLAATAVFVSLLASPLAPHARAARTGADAFCADRLCKVSKPGHRSCWRHAHRASVSKCFIRRAARHFHQPSGQALAIAYRESHYDYRQTNPNSGAAGLYQFMRGTWKHTPYRARSPYQPRWASLAAMWMWAHGGYSHWSL